MDKILDLIIIGSGPAGLSAAIYAKRGGLDYIVIESNYVSGGQVLNTSEVDNYLGFHMINGFDLGMKFREHADKLGTEFINKKVISLDLDEEVKKVSCDDKTTYMTKNILLATGASNMKLDIPGEEEFKGRGVSYCATCDGGFYKGKTVAVVGGGDTALEDAIYLARICDKVHVIHRRDKFRGAKSLEERLISNDNVIIHWNTKVREILGDETVKEIVLEDTKDNEERKINLDGIFIAVGTKPNSELLFDKVEMDENNYIIAGENCATNLKGVFVAGDIRKKPIRQIITAASDGANAINSVISGINVN